MRRLSKWRGAGFWRCDRSFQYGPAVEVPILGDRSFRRDLGHLHSKDRQDQLDSNCHAHGETRQRFALRDPAPNQRSFGRQSLSLATRSVVELEPAGRSEWERSLRHRRCRAATVRVRLWIHTKSCGHGPTGLPQPFLKRRSIEGHTLPRVPDIAVAAETVHVKSDNLSRGPDILRKYLVGQRYHIY